MQPLVCRFWRARPPSLRAVWRCCVAPQVCVAEPRASSALAACMLCPQALGVLHSHRPPGVPHLSPHAGAGGNSVSQQRSHQCSSATHRGEPCGAGICGNSCTVGMRAVQVQRQKGPHASTAVLLGSLRSPCPCCTQRQPLILLSPNPAVMAGSPRNGDRAVQRPARHCAGHQQQADIR